ncbi:GntR family transcriptional regulator [Alicyclobacillus sp. ALC3]|uniref:GntR family transcriptional regulator n=1 Tax=Alicyclobacillus sp. ALC3 TaxID=2796143 RepID=UPI002379D924|nr:GntR family transcriptional regulator [Alicyclobacillus sp. ALC3]WDL98088.1 GntR family transcriptional regulator [Alicyclobacillus sp. ALC3]
MVGEFTSSQPIYLQLVQRLCRQIVRGELSPGEKLPSMRDMAVKVGVNPNTIQRVYTELERITVAETRRGQGTFVTSDEGRLRELRDELMASHVTAFLSNIREMGFTLEEVLRVLQDRQTLDLFEQ